MRLLGTIRLSHDTDESTSPARQREQITRYSELYSHQLVTITEDLDVSGKVSPFFRAELGPWLTGPDKMKQYDAIIVAKLDRLTRSIFDFASLLEWAKEHDKHVISVAEAVDYGTAAGRMYAGILIMFAQFERERMSERRAEAQASLRKQGRWPGGQPPYGYRPSKTGNGYVLVPNEETGPIVLEMMALVLAGVSMNEIARQFTSRNIPAPKGGTTWHADSISRILRSPALAGYVPTANTGEDAQLARDDDGMAIVFTDTPLADPATYAELVQVITSRGAGQIIARNDAAPLLGIAKCGECGNLLYSHVAKPRFYYKCSGIKMGVCTSRNFRKETLEALVTDALLSEVGDVRMKPKPARPATTMLPTVAQVEEAISNLMADRYERNLFSGEDGAQRYTAMMSKLEARQTALSASQPAEQSTKWVEASQTFAEYYGALTASQRRQFMLSAGIRAEVLRTDQTKLTDEEILALLETRSDHHVMFNHGIKVTVHLGDTAELRDLVVPRQLSAHHRPSGRYSLPHD